MAPPDDPVDPAALPTWRAAMADALYGPGGFFVAGSGPAAHFRTSVHAGPPFAGAMLRLVTAVDEALGRPPALDLVDVGSGRGELLTAMLRLAPAGMAARLRPVAVELAPRPADLPAGIRWVHSVPSGMTGVLLATEWLDNVPLDVVVPAGPADPATGAQRAVRYLHVDPRTGREAPGGPVAGADAQWLARWWPSPFARAEIGRTRDEAWAAAVASVSRGLAVLVDYGHLRDARPVDGTLTGYRAGRQVPPVPDGTCDLTAHVAVDAVAEAGGRPYAMVRQREALRALGVDGGRPPLTLAGTDPAGYVRALSAASAAAELTDPAGLGGHRWVLHAVGIDPRSVNRWVGSPVTREMTS